jgi:hypothetical protein
MKPCKLLLWAVAGGLPLCAATFWHGASFTPSPSAALAQTTAPSTDADASATPLPQRRMFMEYLRWRSLPMRDQEAQFSREEEYWKKFQEFMQENSPNRYLLIQRQDLRQGAPARIRMLQRWLNIEAQQTEPALYDVLIQEYKAEDRMIGLAAQLRQATRRNDADLQSTLKQQIHVEAARLVEYNLQQRALRIEDAKKLLAQEQSDLDNDTRDKEQLADDRADQVLQQADRDFRPQQGANQRSLGNP